MVYFDFIKDFIPKIKLIFKRDTYNIIDVIIQLIYFNNIKALKNIKMMDKILFQI